MVCFFKFRITSIFPFILNLLSTLGETVVINIDFDGPNLEIALIGSNPFSLENNFIKLASQVISYKCTGG